MQQIASELVHDFSRHQMHLLLSSTVHVGLHGVKELQVKESLSHCLPLGGACVFLSEKQES
jgi:hypothetical protein